MIKEVDEVIKHAVMASHDGEIKSIAIVMIANGDPEVHMAIHSDDTHTMNAGVDLLKIEMLKLLASRSETKKARE